MSILHVMVIAVMRTVSVIINKGKLLLQWFCEKFPGKLLSIWEFEDTKIFLLQVVPTLIQQKKND